MNINDLWRAADAEAALSATPTEPVPVSSLSGNDQPREWPEIQYDESYPEDEEFLAFDRDRLPLSFALAGEWLLHELPRAAEYMPCFCSVGRGKDIMRKPLHRIYFSTGGWSGAESIIALIERRVDLSHLMVSWRRGGHYVFEVPVRRVPRTVSEIRKQAWATRRQKYGERGHS